MSEQYPPTPVPAPHVAPAPKKGFAVTALVLGIVAILGSWIPFLSIGSAIIGAVGLVFGIIAVVKAFKGTAGGKGMAIAGTVLCVLSIIFAIISTAAGAAAVDEAIDDLDGDITVTTSEESEPAASEPTSAAVPEEEAAEEEPAESTVGTLDNPAQLGDGTVWTVESLGDEWDVTLEAVQIVEGFDGDVAVLTGTATPTVIAEGDVSNWATFPTIGWMAGGASVDDTFDIPTGDFPGDEYRHVIDLEATAGTAMQFHTSVGLPEGVVPEFATISSFLGDDTIYVATGL